MAIVRTNWVSNFTLIGVAKISDFTFKINEKSTKSDWIYSVLNLGIDCGEKHGIINAEMSGGYSSKNNSVIYAHGKNDEGRDDFDKKITVDWNDRFNDNVLEDIGEMSFITVGIEKTQDNKTFYKKFLSAYDAIAYIQEHLVSGMVVNVRGNLQYQEYNGEVRVKKNITNIALSQAEPDKYNARFTQSVLLDKDSANFKNIDKDLGVMYLDTRVLDYVKEINGVTVKGQYPYRKEFEFAMNFSNEEQCQMIYNKLLKVKKDITQITFEGEFVEKGATVMPTLDDLSSDIKTMIDIGMFTVEEALAKCATNGKKVQRMVLKKPVIKMVGEETKTPVLQIEEGKYKEEDLYVTTEETDNKNTQKAKTESTTNDMDWLKNL